MPLPDFVSVVLGVERIKGGFFLEHGFKVGQRVVAARLLDADGAVGEVHVELLDAVSSIADFHETFHQRDGLDADGDPCAVVLVLRADTNGGDHFVVDDAERGGLIRQGVAAFVDAQGNHQIRLLAADVKFEKLHPSVIVVSYSTPNSIVGVTEFIFVIVIALCSPLYAFDTSSPTVWFVIFATSLSIAFLSS